MDSSIVLKYRKVSPEVKDPVIAYDSNGVDFYAYRYEIICDNHNGELFLAFDTGIQVEIPEGYVGILKTRSGLAKKYGATVEAGVIDADYRGNVVVFQRFRSITYDEVDNLLEKPIVQLLILPCPKIQFHSVDTLTETHRGSKGFGSSHGGYR